MPQSRRTVHLLSYAVLITGIALILLSVLAENYGWKAPVVALMRELGLLFAAVIAGTILHEKLLRDEMVRFVISEAGRMIDSKVPKVSELQKLTAESVHDLLCKHPPGIVGLRLVSDKRRNYAGYYTWVMEKKAQELFFAGRSVLHRINADLKIRGNKSAEEVIFRRLREGCKIKILFLDPRTDIRARLAREENQRPEQMARDLAISLGICRRLANLIEKCDSKELDDAYLSVRVYDRVPYFAYHRQDNEVLVGFYFSSLGSESALYDLIGDQARKVFDSHFNSVFKDAQTTRLVEFDNGGRGELEVNETLLSALCSSIEAEIGPKEAARLFGGNADPTTTVT